MRSKDSLEKSMLVGKCEGQKKRGRQRMRWLDNLKKVTGKDLIELKEMVQDRSKWRSFVQDHQESKTTRRNDDDKGAATCLDTISAQIYLVTDQNHVCFLCVCTAAHVLKMRSTFSSS